MHVRVARSCFVLLALSFSSMFSFSSVLSQDVCPNVSELQCAVITRSILNWNDVFGRHIRITDWEYQSEINIHNQKEIVEQMIDPDGIWLPTQGLEGDIISASSLTMLEKDGRVSLEGMKQYEREWEDTINEFASSAEHAIRLDWMIQDKDGFTTLAIVGNKQPFIYDSMLSNVFIVEKSNTCEHTKIRWLFGALRCEIIVDIVPLWQDQAKHCKRMIDGWMHLGKLEFKMGDLKYRGNVCSFEYAYAFITPLVSASFSREGFDVGIAGIGSYWLGNGDCVDSERRD